MNQKECIKEIEECIKTLNKQLAANRMTNLKLSYKSRENMRKEVIEHIQDLVDDKTKKW